MSDRQQIEATLVEEVRKRKGEYHRCNATLASLAFKRSGDERRDAQIIRAAGIANDQALEAWAKAVEDLNEFVATRKVPRWIVQHKVDLSKLEKTAEEDRKL